VFPFLQLLGHSLPPYDFSVPEISSYTVDPHKMGMGVNPSGAIIVKEQSLMDAGYAIPYLAGGAVKTLNITGTRPGASAIAFWALMQYLGKEGFKEIIRKCWDNTCYLKEQLSSISGICLATPPQANVIGIKVTSQSTRSIKMLDARLREKGYALGFFKQYELLRVVMMPHITRDHLDALLADIRAIME
jgi:tyrosine decarboxylase/aspartate 1-decarboxylase